MDEQAAAQIEQLFHTDARVWDLVEPEQDAPAGSVCIEDADGTLAAYAAPTDVLSTPLVR
jgi:hypothetical protein